MLIFIRQGERVVCCKRKQDTVVMKAVGVCECALCIDGRVVHGSSPSVEFTLETRLHRAVCSADPKQTVVDIQSEKCSGRQEPAACVESPRGCVDYHKE
jgi:hypothetical protein